MCVDIKGVHTFQEVGRNAQVQIREEAVSLQGHPHNDLPLNLLRVAFYK